MRYDGLPCPDGHDGIRIPDRAEQWPTCTTCGYQIDMGTLAKLGWTIYQSHGRMFLLAPVEMGYSHGRTRVDG